MAHRVAGPWVFHSCSYPKFPPFPQCRMIVAVRHCKHQHGWPGPSGFDMYGAPAALLFVPVLICRSNITHMGISLFVTKGCMRPFNKVFLSLFGKKKPSFLLQCTTYMSQRLSVPVLFCCSHLGIESSDGSVAVAHKALASAAFALLLLQVGGVVTVQASLQHKPHCKAKSFIGASLKMRIAALHP